MSAANDGRASEAPMSGHDLAARTRIKICGLARPEDARLAARLGADFLGLVLAASPRRIRIDDARAWVQELQAEYPEPRLVGVFVRPSPAEVAEAVEALHLNLVQIHGLPLTASPEPPRGDTLPDARPEPAADDPPVPWIRAVPSSEIKALETLPSGSLASPFARAHPWAVLIDRAGAQGSGGTGGSFDWSLLRGWADRLRHHGSDSRPPRLFLAGGLGPDNVAEAIRAVRPYAVDAASRLEAAPGRKDPALLEAFVSRAREAGRPDDPAARNENRNHHEGMK